MNLENEETRRKKRLDNNDEEVEAIDKLLEETGSYKKLDLEKPTTPVNKPELDDEETLVLSEDLYELVEENEDVIIYKIPEQPQEKRRLDSDETFQVDANSHKISDDETRNVDVDILDDEPSEAIRIAPLDESDIPDFDLHENVESADSSLMNDSQIELERYELMNQEGELPDNVIHSDESQDMQDMSNISHSNSSMIDSADLNSIIEESLDQFLIQQEMCSCCQM